MELPRSSKVTSLPPELLMMIMDRLHKSDMKNVRLVCQDWCGLATPSLFHRIYFSPFPKDLDVFRQWTRTPRCAAAVKELLYDASTMDSTIKEQDYAEWLFQDLGVEEEESINLMDLLAGRTGNPTNMLMLCQKQIVKDGYQAYVEQARQHVELRLSGELIYHLTHGMQHLTYLESVCLEDDDHLQEREDRRQFWYRHWRGGADDDNFRPKFPGPMRQSGSPFARSWPPLYLHPSPYASGEEGQYYVPEAQHPFRLLVTSLSLEHRNVTSLWACLNSDQKVPLSMFDVKGKPSAMLMARHISNVFSTLESLRLNINSYMYNDRAEGCLKSLQDCLVTISCLRDLHICMKGLRSESCSFRNIFGVPRRIWPLLSDFAMEGVHASQQDLVGFLAEHPVRRLKLSRIHLTKGSWVTVADALRKVIPGIEKLSLSNPIGPPFIQHRHFGRTPLMQAVARYIMSGGSNPLREQELA